MSSPPSLSPSPSPSPSASPSPPRAPMFRGSPVPISPRPPIVTTTGPPGSFLVELLIYNDTPLTFKDHWTYWVRSRTNADIGVQVHAAGDVQHGFEFEIIRSYDLRAAAAVDKDSKYPKKRVPLQWVDGRFFDERRMLNGGVRVVDKRAVCGFEESVCMAEVPGKRVDSGEKDISDDESVGRKIAQRDCKTWIVASAEQLLADGIFTREVCAYLRAIGQ